MTTSAPAQTSTAVDTAAATAAAGDPTTAVEIHNATKSFGDRQVLKGVDLTVKKGTVTVILGPSGSGKSTLLRAINHLEKLDEGYVVVGDELVGVRVVGDRFKELHEKQILRQRSKIGFVFQNFNLFPHLTILENIVEAPISLGIKPKAARELARTLLERVGLADKQSAYPRQLSGGQQQRVAIARALAFDPELILFDEPTSALDPELVGEVLGVIRTLTGGGTTLIVVTHEIGFARECADWIVFLDEGRIVEQGRPEDVLDRPRERRTQDFLSKVL
ncbi:amino acid ABC transporter ATP-binding protein [Glaciihabitans sp. dw_435]|uniref:amino acid ABC transporter ATP-binding protein n=1 Tax=Glaciihabitans sp. dw_435 TaxID=2720081 RepID=UPI001BD4AF94|nr:amino acid ABC transporter ATP-binding protein [Glaciihabitans sp. dw_435]